MTLHLDIEENGRLTRTTEIEVEKGDTIIKIAPRLAALLDLDVDELLVDLTLDGQRLDHQHDLFVCNEHHLKHQRVCINLHFETECHEHHFPVRALWSRVHRWACKHFNVPDNACVNLELHDGAPDGPALNDEKEVGAFHGCKTVWLVKPGPEHNGASR